MGLNIPIFLNPLYFPISESQRRPKRKRAKFVFVWLKEILLEKQSHTPPNNTTGIYMALNYSSDYLKPIVKFYIF